MPTDDRALAEKVLRAHFTATAALIAPMLRNLPDDVRTRTFEAVRNGTGSVELRTRVESNETELVLVATNGSEPLWLARKRPHERAHPTMWILRAAGLSACSLSTCSLGS